MTSHNETGRAPRDVIEAMLGYLETSTGSADLEFGIAGEDYRVVWDSVDSAGVIVATVYDITDTDSDREVTRLRVSFEEIV